MNKEKTASKGAERGRGSEEDETKTKGAATSDEATGGKHHHHGGEHDQHHGAGKAHHEHKEHEHKERDEHKKEQHQHGGGPKHQHQHKQGENKASDQKATASSSTLQTEDASHGTSVVATVAAPAAPTAAPATAFGEDWLAIGRKEKAGDLTTSSSRVWMSLPMSSTSSLSRKVSSSSPTSHQSRKLSVTGEQDKQVGDDEEAVEQESFLQFAEKLTKDYLFGSTTSKAGRKTNVEEPLSLTGLQRVGVEEVETKHRPSTSVSPTTADVGLEDETAVHDADTSRTPSGREAGSTITLLQSRNFVFLADFLDFEVVPVSAFFLLLVAVFGTRVVLRRYRQGQVELEAESYGMKNRPAASRTPGGSSSSRATWFGTSKTAPHNSERTPSTIVCSGSRSFLVSPESASASQESTQLQHSNTTSIGEECGNRSSCKWDNHKTASFYTFKPGGEESGAAARRSSYQTSDPRAVTSQRPESCTTHSHSSSTSSPAPNQAHSRRPAMLTSDYIVDLEQGPRTPSPEVSPVKVIVDEDHDGRSLVKRCDKDQAEDLFPGPPRGELHVDVDNREEENSSASTSQRGQRNSVVNEAHFFRSFVPGHPGMPPKDRARAREGAARNAASDLAGAQQGPESCRCGPQEKQLVSIELSSTGNLVRDKTTSGPTTPFGEHEEHQYGKEFHYNLV
ncbi:unnamed protein product [Amoebophrya sp. A120]|nr:unnamed protein product [Amoebophrya sp. A120]|eukprot:GSA120T00022244001.1